MIVDIETIIKDKNELQKIICSISGDRETYARDVAELIAPKLRKWALKYHPDKIKEKYYSLPYVAQIYSILARSSDLLQDYIGNFRSYDLTIRAYKGSEKIWNEEEDKKGLGPIRERIQRVVEEEKLRKVNSLKRKDDEEKLRKLNSL